MADIIVQFDGSDYYNLPSDININTAFDFNFDFYLNSTKDSYENLIGFGSTVSGFPTLIVQAYKGSNYLETCLIINSDQDYNDYEWTAQHSNGTEEWFNCRLYRSGYVFTLVITKLSDNTEKTATLILDTGDTLSNFTHRILGGYIGEYYSGSGGTLQDPIANGGKIKGFEGTAEFKNAYTDSAKTILATVGSKIYTIANYKSSNDFVQSSSSNQGILATGSDNSEHKGNFDFLNDHRKKYSYKHRGVKRTMFL